MAVGTSKIVQVTNIAPQATKDQMQILFGYLGKIEDIRLYPTIRDVSCPVQSRICYIKFVDSSTVGIAQHMTNTVFIDRALIVIPISSGEIPDEYYALEMTKNATIVPGLTPADPQLPPHVVNSTHKSGDEQVIITVDPNLHGSGLPPYPPLPATYDTAKIEETRRTVLMLNYNSSMNNNDIIDFFSAAGEVKYLRVCKRESDDSSHLLIEFSDQPSVVNAIKLSGTELNGQIIEVEHATQPITKPQAKSNEAAQKEIEEAMSRFKEAQNMINASIEPVIGMLTKDKRSSRRSRSRSRSRRKRSRSRSRRSRSRRRRSSSRSRRSRSRDHRKRSRSRGRRHSRSRSRRSRSRSVRSKRSRSRSRRRSRHRSKERSRGKSRDKDRKSRERSRDRKRSKDRDREKDKEKDRERDKKSKERDSIEKEKTPKESKEKKNDKESSVEDKRKSRSRSRSKRRSRSRDRKTRDRKRSRSRGSRRRSPSPRTSRRRSRTRSRDRDRKRDKKTEKRDKDRRDKDRRSRSKERERKSRSRSRSSRSTRSHSKVPRNYDEEEKGFDTDKDKPKDKEIEQPMEKGSPEKSDNMDISNSP